MEVFSPSVYLLIFSDRLYLFLPTPVTVTNYGTDPRQMQLKDLFVTRPVCLKTST